jgi:hypothetical protein
VLDRELADVIAEFTKLTGDKLPALNQRLAAKKLGELKVISETDWQATHKDDTSAPPAGMMRREWD